MIYALQNAQLKRHVGILSITGQEWDLQTIRLKTVRPFVIDDIELQKIEHLSPDDPSALNLFLHQEVCPLQKEFTLVKVERLIEKAKEQWKAHNPELDMKECPKPLVRLKVS